MRALSSRAMLAYAFVCSACLHGQSYAFAPGGCAHFFASSRSPPSWQHKRHARIVLITTPPPALALLVCCTREGGSREALDEGRDQLWGDTAPREAVLKRLEQARAATGAGSAEEKDVQKFLKRLKKKSGLISVLPEFSRDEELVHHDLSDLSRACREMGAGAVMVQVDIDDGFQDLMSMVKEQKAACSTSRGSSSASGSAFAGGACPIIQRGALSTSYDLARAAVLGAQAVVLAADRAGDGAEALDDLVGLCGVLGLGCIVEASDAVSLAAALAAKAQVVSIRGVLGLEEALALRALIPPQIIAMVGVPSMMDQCAEIDQIRQLERAGYNSVVLINSARSEGEEQYVRWALERLQDKKSASISFPQDIKKESEGPYNPAERWAKKQAKRDPIEYDKWLKYKKTRDYQIKCQVWGQVGGC